MLVVKFFVKKNPKTFGRKHFWAKNFRFFVEKCFVEKVNENSKFWNFEKISKKFEISNFWIFIDFFIEKFFGKKSKIFGPKKHFDQKFSDFFRRKIFRRKIFGSPISIPNDPKIPKITLRTACDHYKITNSEHEEKVTFFLFYLTSGGSQVHEPSVYHHRWSLTNTADSTNTIFGFEKNIITSNYYYKPWLVVS